MRVVIIGNSGSGKTWLADQIAQSCDVHVVHFDEIFWLPKGFNQQRPDSQVLELIDEELSRSSWVAEGVFGKIASKFLPQASVLVWLELPLDVCVNRLRIRGSESKRHMNREQSENGLSELLAWAGSYYERTGSSSCAAHQTMYDTFAGERHKLHSELEVVAYLSTVTSAHPRTKNEG